LYVVTVKNGDCAGDVAMLLHLKAGQIPLMATVKDTKAKADQEIIMEMEHEKIRLFDKKTTKAIIWIFAACFSKNFVPLSYDFKQTVHLYFTLNITMRKAWIKTKRFATVTGGSSVKMP